MSTIEDLQETNHNLGADFNAASDQWKAEKKALEKHIRECVETNNAYLERCRKAEAALAKIRELHVSSLEYKELYSRTYKILEEYYAKP